jgi:hypothetical protein
MLTSLIIDCRDTRPTRLKFHPRDRETWTYILYPLSGWTMSVPSYVPSLFALKEPGWMAIALPMPPIVSPVDSLASLGMRPNPTRPYVQLSELAGSISHRFTHLVNESLAPKNSACYCRRLVLLLCTRCCSRNSVCDCADHAGVRE